MPQGLKVEWIDWILAYRLRHKSTLGKCQEATKEMKEAFPELEIVKGHVDTSWGRRGHWWLVAPDGTIVDPTSDQFEAIFEYEPWVPGSEVRVGKCMNCGTEIWREVQTLDPPPKRESVCSFNCEMALSSETSWP